MLGIDGETSTYTALNFGKDDGPSSTYSVLNFRKEEDLVHEYDDPPIASGPAELSVTPQAGAHDQESKLKIGKRLHCLICLLCLVTFALIVTVTAFSIHVSQIRQSQNTLDQNCHELNSTLQSEINEMETKYKAVNETKAQICELLTSRREQTCSKDWISNKDRCYYVSTFGRSFYSAMRECSNCDSRLLQINSRDEARFVSDKLVSRNSAYWIGQCEDGNVAWGLLYKQSSGTSNCKDCRSYPGKDSCERDRRFICEKAAPLFRDIPERIQNLCQQPVETT
ncbi:uncharacterized protein [Mobula birostris]|uniref:uncharacterized protein n=1 Tax=Mobula birostris TaxID=1983395 RepID=UPI003B285EB3